LQGKHDWRSSGSTDFIDSATRNNRAYAADAGNDQVTGIGVSKGYTFAAVRERRAKRT
jgi:hypothetical protein